jgi:hypothetical protein
MTLRQTSIQAFYEHRESFNSKLLTHLDHSSHHLSGVLTSIGPLKNSNTPSLTAQPHPVSRCLLVQHVQLIRRLIKARDSSVPRLRLFALACLVCQMSIP